MTSGQLQIPYNQFSEHDEAKLKELSLLVNGDMIEVGCWTGHSTSILAQRAKDINKTVVVVDNFKGNEGTPLQEFAESNSVYNIFVNNMRELGLYHNVQVMYTDSNNAHSNISNNSYDLLFIDAGHTYSQVKNDLINYIPKVKKGGIICGHDYESDTFDEAHINEDYVNGKHHGVIKAVNEVLGIVSHEGRMWWKINEN